MRADTEKIRTDRGCLPVVTYGEFISRADKNTSFTYLLTYLLTPR